MDLLQWLVKGTLVVFVVSSMLSIGLAVQRAQIVAPLRSPAWILRALLANFVLAPVVALSIGAVLTIDPGYELGLLLLGFAAGAPLLPKLAEAGRADVASATALMVLLMAASVVVMPLALPLFVKGAQVNAWQIAAPLVVLMLAPLALGMAARSLAPRIGARLLPVLTQDIQHRLCRRGAADLRHEPHCAGRGPGQRRDRRSDALRRAAVRGCLGPRRTASGGPPPAGLCNGRPQRRRGPGHRRGERRRAERQSC